MLIAATVLRSSLYDIKTYYASDFAVHIREAVVFSNPDELCFDRVPTVM